MTGKTSNHNESCCWHIIALQLFLSVSKPVTSHLLRRCLSLCRGAELQVLTFGWWLPVWAQAHILLKQYWSHSLWEEVCETQEKKFRYASWTSDHNGKVVSKSRLWCLITFYNTMQMALWLYRKQKAVKLWSNKSSTICSWILNSKMRNFYYRVYICGKPQSTLSAEHRIFHLLWKLVAVFFEDKSNMFHYIVIVQKTWSCCSVNEWQCFFTFISCPHYSPC